MKYRVRAWPAIEATAKEKTIECKTKKDAVIVQNAIADILLFLQDDIKVMHDYSNSIIIERVSSCGTWEEIG